MTSSSGNLIAYIEEILNNDQENASEPSNDDDDVNNIIVNQFNFT
jgi:hypothetical protein